MNCSCCIAAVGGAEAAAALITSLAKGSAELSRALHTLVKLVAAWHTTAAGQLLHGMQPLL
jgi:hypothetical protein